jgi:hypothetical protein
VQEVRSIVALAEPYLRPAGVIECAGRQVKLYHLSADGGRIADSIQKAAYGFLPRLLPRPDDETPPAGWAVLFKASGIPAYLIAYSWTWVNVVECRAAAAGHPELGCEDENPEHFTALDRRWIGCAWELAPLGHERSAWIRYVLARETPDLAGYLTDVMPEGSAAERRP